MPRDSSEGLWYVREPARFWDACIELVDRLGVGDSCDMRSARSAESISLDNKVGQKLPGHSVDRELEHVWSRVAAQLATTVDEPTYRLWLESLRAVKFSDERLLLVAPANCAAWIRERFDRLIQAAAQSVLGPDVTVEFANAGAGWQTSAPLSSAMLGPTSNPRLTFDQFIVGDSNRFAHAAALAVVERPAQVYNPLFVCGPPGVGKTHLLSSIGNRLHAGNPDVVIRSTTGEAFTGELLNAASAGGLEAFKLRFRDINALLVDDFQFLDRKTQIEDEFFHTFIALHDAGCQIVLASDRPPDHLQAIDERLRARLEAGLVAEIRPPDYALRLSILRQWAQRDGLVCEDDAIRVIAEHVHTNVRALEGALIRVVAFSSLTGRPFTADLAREVLATLYPRSRTGANGLTISEIQAAVGQEFDLTTDELLSSTRTARIAWPRQIAMYLARELTSESLPAIGRHFGGRDHTTVLHAWRRASARIGTDDASRKVVEKICREIDRPGKFNSLTIEVPR
jgi:chromosomal replication initiator protein